MSLPKVRANGPWAYLEIIRPEKFDGLEKSKGGLYLPSGNSEERTGLSKAKVISIGPGIWNEDHQAYDDPGVKPDDVVLFRGYLEEVNPVPWSDDHCFIHIKDLVGFPEEEAGAEV